MTHIVEARCVIPIGLEKVQEPSKYTGLLSTLAFCLYGFCVCENPFVGVSLSPTYSEKSILDATLSIKVMQAAYWVPVVF